MSALAPGPEEIRDYLLRRMQDQARGRFEEAYFQDDTLLDRIEAEEDALVSDYVLGRLDTAERRLFEASLLGTPYYKERVETTSRLKLKIDAPGLFRGRAEAPGGDARLFPGRSGAAVAVGLLTLLLVAALVSAMRLKSDLTRARLELARPLRVADPATLAGVVPLAQTVLFAGERSAGPAITTLRRAAGGSILLSFPRSLAGRAPSTLSVALLDGKRVVWESAAFPSKDVEEGDLSLRLPPGVPPAGSYAVLLRAPGTPEKAETLLGILEIIER